MFGLERLYVVKSTVMVDRHGHFLNCAVTSIYEVLDPIIGLKLASGFNLFGAEYADLPERCGWLNLVDADES